MGYVSVLICLQGLMMPSNHLIFYHPLLILPSIFPSISRTRSHAATILTHAPDQGTLHPSPPMTTYLFHPAPKPHSCPQLRPILHSYHSATLPPAWEVLLRALLGTQMLVALFSLHCGPNGASSQGPSASCPYPGIT